MATIIFFTCFLISVQAHANSIENLLFNDLNYIEEITYDNLISQKADNPHLVPLISANALDDKDNKVNGLFKINDFFRPSVNFWFDIYTKYNSSMYAIHDKENLSIVYQILNFNQIDQSHLHKYTKYHLKKKKRQQAIHQIRQILNKLSKNPRFESNQVEKIKQVFTNAGIKVPTNYNLAKKFYSNRLKNLRTQTGQRDYIHKGLKDFIFYIDFFKRVTSEMELPHELMAIPFLESSFNTHAESKVGATGMWQFIQSTGKLFMIVDSNIDHRSNPFISSIAGLQLLADNFKILKQWDLSIAAYNSGFKHLSRWKSKVKNKNVETNLADFINNYKHPTIGFASKNFYSEFLALTHVLAYREQFFKSARFSKKKGESGHLGQIDNIKFFVSKCSFRPQDLFKQFKYAGQELPALNKHFNDLNKSKPPGTIIVSKLNLSNKKFYEVSKEVYTKIKPKDWRRQFKYQSCSTK